MLSSIIFSLKLRVYAFPLPSQLRQLNEKTANSLYALCDNIYKLWFLSKPFNTPFVQAPQPRLPWRARQYFPAAGREGSFRHPALPQRWPWKHRSPQLGHSTSSITQPTTTPRCAPFCAKDSSFSHVSTHRAFFELAVVS